jgi:hypothetical protein
MPPKRILAFHGVAQSGPIFARRTSTITTHLSTLGYTIHFLTAPHSIAGTPYTIARQADYQSGDAETSWWTTDDSTASHPSIALFLSTVATAIKTHGPFVAALGFSQGGCAAASIAALLEPSRRGGKMVRQYLGEEVLDMQPPLEFLILFSANPYRFPLSKENDVDVLPLFYPEGFEDYPYSQLAVPTWQGMMLVSGKSTTTTTTTTTTAVTGSSSSSSSTSPATSLPPSSFHTSSPSNNNTLSTPTLAFYGQKEWSTDPFSRSRQQWFISRFEDIQVQPHPWKHTVPRTEEYAEVVVGFVRRVEKDGRIKSEPKRERVKVKL